VNVSEVKKTIVDRIVQSRDCYIQDLEAMDESVLQSSPGGEARIPMDFTYEVIYVNQRILCRLRGEEPETFPSDGWITAPLEFQSKSALVTGIRETTDQIIEAWNSLPDDEINKKISLPSGETSPIGMVNLCATHLTYHDAQLNYIQSLNGDNEMHWS